MSKRQKIIIASVISFVTLFCIIFVILDSVSKKIYLDESLITEEIVYDDDFDYSQIVLVDKSLFSKDIIPITDDMIVQKIDSTRPGYQTIVIEYSDKKFEIQVTVKFKIEFVVDNEVIDTQMVLSKDEIIYPSEPLKNGYDFLGWTDIPDELTGNLQIEAVYGSGEYIIPELSKLSAQYGDKLSSLTLPSNQYGAWEFTSSLDTLVGNPGTISFDVRFIPSDANRPILNDIVTVDISKRKIDFINVVDRFTYDGNSHKPTFELSEDVDVEVFYYGFERTEVIKEPYALEINSDYYEGSYEGELVINKCPITISINSYEITYSEVLPTIEWNVEGTKDIDNIGISLVPLASKLNAGEYDLDVTVSNPNYDSTINKGKLKINKATLDVVNPDYLKKAVYSELLSTVEFNNNYTTGSWSWKNPELVIDEPTSFIATAIFTPNDTTNYKIIERELTIPVDKKTLDIVINENEFVYDGNSHSAIFTIGDGIEGIPVKYYENSKEFDGSKIDAGKYRVKILIDDLRYQGEINFDLIINQAQNMISDLTIEGWTYGDEPNIPSANSEFGQDNIEFTYSTEENGAYSSEVPTNAGTYYVKAKSEGTKNYISCEKTKSFTISKRDVEVIWVTSESYTYTGNKFNIPTASITLVDTSNYSLKVSTDKEEFINAGTYTFTASTTVEEILNNYNFINYEKIITVEKATVSITDLNIEGWTYGDMVKEPTATTNFGSIVYSYATSLDGEYTSTVPTNAGTYYVKATVLGTDNYNGAVATYEFTIKKKSVSVSWNVGSYTYTGSELTNPTASIQLVDGTNHSLTVSATQSFINAGTYTFTASTDVELILNNYEISNTTKNVTVEKGSAVITDLNIEGWTYGDTAKEPTAATNFGTIVFTYSSTLTGTYTSTVPTKAGTYYVKASVVETDNYNGAVATYEFTILKKAVSVSWNVGSYTYTGSELTNPTASIKLVDGTNHSLTVSATQAFVNAGTYTFTASTDVELILNNYEISNTTKNVTVEKATAEITDLAIEGWTYGDMANAPTATTNFGEIIYSYETSLDGEYTSTVPTNAGTYYVRATVLGTDNFNGSEATYEFTILKKAVSVSWTVGIYTYTGNVLTNPTASITLVDGTDYELNVTTTNEFKNAGTYTFTAVIADSTDAGNYILTNDTYEVTVDKKEVAAPVIEDLLYTGEHQVPSISDTELYSVVENAGGTNAGTYYVVLQLNDFNNYKWSTSLEDKITIEYDIYLNNNEWTTNPSVSDVTYKEEVTPIAEAKFGTVTVTYIYPDGSSSIEKPTNVGEYKAVFTATAEGYRTLTETVNFKIKQAKYMPSVPSGLTAQYGDLISSVIISTSDEGTWSLVSEKLSFDSVGTVTMKAQFVPSDKNYYSDPIDVQIAVTKRLVTIVIIKDEFEYTGNVQKLTFVIYDGDNELSDISVVGNEGLTNVGSISQTLTIDSEYYQGFITHTLTITKKIVNVISIQSKEYTGEVLTADIEESTLYTVTENLGGTNVGFYNVVLTLKDSSNYKWETTESSSVEINFEITKANATITDLAIEGWTYGDAAKEPTATTNIGSIVYTYAISLDGEYTSTVPTNAGTYYVKATVLGTDNYNGAVATYEFTISKKAVSVSWNVGSYTYTGNMLTNPTASITLVDGTDYELTVSTTKEFKNAGIYTFTASTEDLSLLNNYEITNTTKDVTVGKANAEILNLAIEGWTYGDTTNAPTATTNFGAIVYSYATSLDGEYTSTVPTNAGTYYVKATVLGTDNYNGYETEAISYTISKKSVSVSWNVGSYTYTGNVLTNPTASITLVDGTNYELIVTTTKEFKNAGTYTFTSSTEDTSILNNYEISNTTKDVTVEKGSVVITDFAIEGWTYGNTPNAPTATTNFGTIVYTYSSTLTGTYTSTVPTNAGTYYVKACVEGTVNYNGAEETYEFKISKKSVSVSWNVGSYTYTGNVLTNPTASITLVDGTSYSLIVSSIIEFKNAGTYTFTASIEDSLIAANYTITNATKDVTVEKERAVITNFAIEGWTYGNTPNNPTATTNFGTIVYTYSSKLTGTYTSTVPTNAGTYYVKASVVETDNYYGYVTEAISFTISKATPTVVWPEYNNTNYEDRFNPETDYSNTPSTNGTFIFDEVTYSDTFSSTITIKVTFKPTDSNNYLELTNTITVTMSPVAYIGSTNYGTVEKALNAAVSGNTVYVIIGTNPIIKANCYIKSGVTLALPYDGTTTLNREGTAATFGDENASLVASNLKTNLTITEGITLTIESGGTLTIGGVLGNDAQGISAQTSGSYCQITLEANAKIASEGTINCFGFIKESSLNNGSQVICTSGNVNMPFVVYDFRGGTSTTASYKKGGIAPFNVYDMPNIQSLFTLHSAATLTAYVDLYASSKHNTSQATIISNSSGLLILNSGSYITFKYTPEKFGYTTQLGRTNVKIYGGAKTGSMSMNVSIATVNTANVFFGISWKFDYELYSGTYTINNQYKFMTGSSLFVNSDATLNVDGSLIFYQSFTDVSYGGYVYPSKNPAKFIMNGTLNINGTFGGVVETTLDGSVMNVSTSAKLLVSSNEGHGEKEGKFGTKFVLVATISESLRGYAYGSNKLTNFAAGTFYSKDEHWYSEYINIYYETNGGIITSPSEGPYQIDANGYTLNNINVSNPTREHYTFGGWYVDKELTEAVGGQKVYTSIYVYAKWIPVEYDITYQNVFENCSEEEIANSNPSTYNIESYFTLSIPTSVSGLTFIGWFTDSACTQVINVIDGSLYGTDITIYGLWNPVGTSKYTVNIVTNNTDYDDSTIYFFETKPDAFILPDYTIKNTDKEYSKYFLGFYIDDENTLVDRDYIINNIGTLSTNNELTINGKWVDKYKITLKDVYVTLYGYNQTVTLPSAPEYDTWTDNTDYISHIQKYWLANGTDYYYADGSATFTATCDTEFELTTKETRYFAMDFILKKASVTVNATNGIVLDTSGSIYSSNTLSSNTRIYVLEGVSIALDIDYNGTLGGLLGGTCTVTPKNGSSSNNTTFTMTSTTYVIEIIGR